MEGNVDVLQIIFSCSFYFNEILNFLRFLGTEISKSPLRYLQWGKLISKFHQKYLEQLILHQRNQWTYIDDHIGSFHYILIMFNNYYSLNHEILY
jgi:hypothetical protein